MTDRTYRLTRDAEKVVESTGHVSDTANAFMDGYVSGGEAEAERGDENHKQLMGVLHNFFNEEDCDDEITFTLRKIHDQWSCYVEGRVMGVASDTLDEAMLGAFLCDEDEAVGKFPAICSFCKTPRQDAERMVAGPGDVRICAGCLRVAHQIVIGSDEKTGPRPVPGGLSVIVGREPFPCPSCDTNTNMQPHKGIPAGLLCHCGYEITYDEIEVRGLLRDHGFDDVQAVKWIVTPHEELGGDTPRQVLQRGNGDALKDLLMSKAYSP